MTLRDVKEAYPHFFAACLGGADCEDGWVPMIDALCKFITNEIKYSIINLQDPHGPKDYMDLGEHVIFSFTQIKEKFGTLRAYFTCSFTKYTDLADTIRASVPEDVYTQATDKLYNRVSAAVSMTERMSSFTCEFSGCPGQLCVPADAEAHTWFKTMSDTVAADKGYRPFPRS